MADVHGDISSNRRLWNEHFSNVQPEELAEKVRDPHAWLASPYRATSYGALMTPEVLERLPGARVLELGAGTSGLSLAMGLLGASVTAIDIADESARINGAAAEELGISERITPIAGDLAEVLVDAEPQSFDLVICQAFWHHLTPELEDAYLPIVARVVAADGEVRSYEPAVNSRVLDEIRWLIPVKGRPSYLNRRKFQRWKEGDSHPERDNSGKHYRRIGAKYFESVEVTSYGGIERLHRFGATGVHARQGLRKALVKVDAVIPDRVQDVIARSQLIVYRRPRQL